MRHQCEQMNSINGAFWSLHIPSLPARLRWFSRLRQDEAVPRPVRSYDPHNGVYFAREWLRNDDATLVGAF